MFQVDAKWKGIFISVIRQGWSEKAVGRGNGDATCVLDEASISSMGGHHSWTDHHRVLLFDDDKKTIFFMICDS